MVILIKIIIYLQLIISATALFFISLDIYHLMFQAKALLISKYILPLLAILIFIVLYIAILCYLLFAKQYPNWLVSILPRDILKLKK